MTFCCTVSHGNTDPCCEIMIPFRLGPVRFTPSIRIAPRSGRSKPAMTFSKVDLPQPDGPTIATNSPSATSKLTSWTTGSSPKFLLSPSTTICLSDIAPLHRIKPLEQAGHAVEQQADHADDDHARDHQVVAVASVARIHDQVSEAGVERDHLGGDHNQPGDA